jgi:hypothetical protein
MRFPIGIFKIRALFLPSIQFIQRSKETIPEKVLSMGIQAFKSTFAKTKA